MKSPELKSKVGLALYCLTHFFPGLKLYFRRPKFFEATELKTHSIGNVSPAHVGSHPRMCIIESIKRWRGDLPQVMKSIISFHICKIMIKEKRGGGDKMGN